MKPMHRVRPWLMQCVLGMDRTQARLSYQVQVEILSLLTALFVFFVRNPCPTYRLHIPTNSAEEFPVFSLTPLETRPEFRCRRPDPPLTVPPTFCLFVLQCYNMEEFKRRLAIYFGENSCKHDTTAPYKQHYYSPYCTRRDCFMFTLNPAHFGKDSGLTNHISPIWII